MFVTYFTDHQTSTRFLRDLGFTPIPHGRNVDGHWDHPKYPLWRAIIDPVLLPYGCSRVTVTRSGERLWHYPIKSLWSGK